MSVIKKKCYNSTLPATGIKGMFVANKAGRSFHKAFVDGVTAAAIGAITGAVFVLGKRQLTDVTAAAIAVITMLLLLKFKKLQAPFIIIAAGLAGLLINYLH